MIDLMEQLGVAFGVGTLEGFMIKYTDPCKIPAISHQPPYAEECPLPLVSL